jgi:hypothetical protein
MRAAEHHARDRRAGQDGLIFPIKLRCLSAADLLAEPGLEAGLARVLGRAFARARSALPATLAIGGGVALQPPCFDRNALSGSQATALLTRIQRAIAAAARAQSLPTVRSATPARLDRQIRLTGVPDQIADGLAPGAVNSAVQRAEVWEPLDPARYDRKHGTYLLDSYKGGDAPVEVLSFEPEVISTNTVEVVKIAQEIADPDAVAEMEILAQKASPEHPLGVIYRVREGGDVAKWRVVITTGGPLENVFGFTFGSFSEEQYMGPKASPMFKKVVVVPSPGPASAEVVIDASDRAALKAQYMKLQRGRFDIVVRHARTPVNLTTTKFHQILEANFEHTIDQDIAAVPDGVTKAVLVRLSGQGTLVWFGSDAAENLKKLNGRKAQLTAIVAFEQRAKSEKRKGEPGGVPGGAVSGGSPEGKPGGTGLCPPDIRPDDHPPDDVDESAENLPFLGEPALEEIGDAGEALKEKMAALATRLELKECNYAGQFCYHAAAALRIHAINTQFMTETATGENAPPRGGKGNMGVLDFRPSGSPIIARIRELAEAVSELGKLMNYVSALFESQAYHCSIHGIWRGQGTSWVLRFLEAVVPEVKEAVGQLFVGACRSMLLQLLGTSLQEIEKRQKAMPRYAVLFERWIVPMIADLGELQTMRQILRLKQLSEIAAPAVVGLAPGQAWVAASGSLVLSLRGNPFTQDTGGPYTIVRDQGIEKIRDSKGRLWSSDDLEQALSLQGQIAEGVDPLVKQIVDTPEARKRFKDAQSVQTELIKLLNEMVQNNKEMAGKAMGDPVFAFRSSRIDEDIPSATVSGSKYALQGIHKVAHEQIADAFRNSPLYAAGIDDLFDTEEGRKALTGALLLTGFVLLSVLVPGGAFIAFAAGGALAARELASAYEKERLYRALIDPDLVLQYADVEAEKFAAWVGVVISAIPEAGPAVKGLIAGGKAVVRGEAKSLAKMAGKAVAARLARELAEYAVKDLLAAFIKETVLNVIIDQVIEQALGPIIERVRHEASIGHSIGGPAPTAETGEPGEQEFIEMIRSLEPT